MKVDYLIVGSGIAGTVLSFLLSERGKTFMVVDRAAFSSASKASAGICNPIVFKRLTTGWKVAQLMPKARSVYAAFEKVLHASFVQERKILKLFTSAEEKAFWEKKIHDPELNGFLSIAREDFSSMAFHVPFGAGKVEQAMQVNIGSLLEKYQHYLEEKESMRVTDFRYEDLTIDQEQVTWKDIEAQRIVFCEGYKLRSNPWLNWLPLSPVKGEALIIRSPELKISHLINRRVILCPLGNDLFWVGATYHWEHLNETPTDDARQELTNVLDQLLKVPYEVVEHKAGVRPAVRDRRPLAGVHPHLNRLFIFNGMGTKGTLLAPYFASQLIDFMEEGKELDPEVTIERFYDLYQPSGST